jgi:mono/diheme cytochrome c family protein
MKKSNTMVVIIIILLVFSLTGCINRGAGNQGGSGNSDQNDNAAVSTDADAQNGPEDIVSLSDVSKGLTVWKNSGCTNCHTIGDDPGGSTGPSLTGIGDKYTVEQLKVLITDPRSIDPQAQMPSQNVAGENLDYLAKYLSVLSTDVPDEEDLKNPAEQ